MANDSQPSFVIACAAAFLAICPIIVSCRLYTRKAQALPIGTDDWLAVCALIMVVGCAVTTIVGVHLHAFGYPTPQDDPTNYDFRTNEQLEWAFFLMQILSMGFVKLSFIFFFRRVFYLGRRTSAFNIVSMAIAVLIVLWTTVFLLWFLFSCPNNFAGRWTSVKVYHVSCPTDGVSDLALASSDIGTDIIVFALPVPMVLRLQMKLVRKLVVLFVFVLGSLALVASIIRLAYFVYAVKVSEGEINDPSLDNNVLVTRGIYWSMLESGLALVCCCLPTLNKFVQLPGVQSTIQAARGVLTLGSSGNRSHPPEHGKDRHAIQRTESSKNLSPQTSGQIELGDLRQNSTTRKNSGHDGSALEGGILGEHRIEQYSSHA